MLLYCTGGDRADVHTNSTPIQGGNVDDSARLAIPGAADMRLIGDRHPN